jgi:hypothetical protein
VGGCGLACGSRTDHGRLPVDLVAQIAGDLDRGGNERRGADQQIARAHAAFLVRLGAVEIAVHVVGERLHRDLASRATLLVVLLREDSKLLLFARDFFGGKSNRAATEMGPPKWGHST